MSETLIQSLLQIDDQASELRSDAECEWVRSKLGVIGLIRVPEPASADALDSLLEQRVAHAHALLDELSDQALQLEDLWNLTLLIGVPWTRQAAAVLPEVVRILLRWARNTSGSRKVILWHGTTIADYLGPLGGGAAAWVPPTGEPLREAIAMAAGDEQEKHALEILFKRRIEESDIDDLIRVLGRRPAP